MLGIVCRLPFRMGQRPPPKEGGSPPRGEQHNSNSKMVIFLQVQHKFAHMYHILAILRRFLQQSKPLEFRTLKLFGVFASVSLECLIARSSCQCCWAPCPSTNRRWRQRREQKEEKEGVLRKDALSIVGESTCDTWSPVTVRRPWPRPWE